jgi:hypothetical protein
VCVYVYAIEIAVVTTGIDLVTVDGRYASRARETDRPGSVIGKTPEFFATGEVEAPKVIAYLIVPVEQIDLAVLDDRSAVPPANSNSP